MTTKYLIKIKDYILPIPSSYKATTIDIVDSGRNVEGKMIGSVIREDVARIDITYKYITASDYSNILKLFVSKFGGSFINEITFYNQVTNEYETREFYIGDRKSDALRFNEETEQIEGYKDITLSFIEV